MFPRLIGPAVSLILLAAQQQQPPVFRSGVATVAIYATVTDRYGQLVRNLRREDFQVFDNGRRQELTVFSNALQPITAVLLVDTSASMALTLDLARQAAEQFVIRMLPGDRARVGSFSDRLDLSRAFTGDRDELLRALREDLHIGNPTRLWDAVRDTMTALAGEGGRRVVVLFTDGEDTASDSFGREVLERAKAEELMIYSVQIRSRVRPGVERLIVGPTSRPSVANRVPDLSPTQVLRGLAGQTGGAHFTLNQNDDVNATFTQVAVELHYQYLLGFAPQSPDGQIHDLQVRVRDGRHQVRARRFYLAPKGTP